MLAADSPLSLAHLPDPLRLIGPTIGSSPVGRFKRSGTGENDAGNLHSGRGMFTVMSLQNPINQWLGNVLLLLRRYRDNLTK